MRNIRGLIALIVAVTISLFGITPQAQAGKRQDEFIVKLVDAARETQREYGIPASVTLGMAALETGWGRSSMTREPINTLFNIKCTKTPSKYQKGCAEVASYEYRKDGTRYLQVSKFRSYASWGDSIKDFGLFLTSLKRYRKAFDHKDDPDAFVREVHRGGYATDPRYASLVTGIMRSYNLYRYDFPGNSGSANGIGSGQPSDQGEFVALTFGSANNHVITLQRLLNAVAGARISADGKYGWQTQQAVADFQHKKFPGQEITGEMDLRTWRALVPKLAKGDSGELVKVLQQELKYAGYRVSVDGAYGNQTRRFVADFQRSHGLAVTGVVDQGTWGKLLGS